MRKSKLSLFIRIFLSIFLLYHLAVILILPNPGSLLGRTFARYLSDYANNLGINTTWQFFSPGPAPTFYLEYEVESLDPNYEDLDESPTIRFPEYRRASYYDEFYSRTISAMRFFVLAPETTFERFFVPWLCKRHPGAERLSIRTVGEPVVNIERATGEESFDDLTQRTALKARRSYSCVSETFFPDEAELIFPEVPEMKEDWPDSNEEGQKGAGL